MSIKDQFIQQYKKLETYCLIKIFNEDGTSFILYMHDDSSLHDLYKNVKLHKNEDIFSYNNLLIHNDNVLPNYGHVTLKESLYVDEIKREFSIYYKNKKNVNFEDLSPKENKWVWPPKGGFVCGR